MSQRFFVEAALASDRVQLTGPEAHHLARVMRAAVGDEYVLFDGRGGECLARITHLTKTLVDLDVIERRPIERETAKPIELAVALPKGDRQHFLIEKAVELGVTRLIPLSTEFSVAEAKEKARERMHQWGIEACKQCRRNRLMTITEPWTVAELAAGHFGELQRIVAHPGGKPLAELPQPARGVIAAIGPEGGFSEAEAGLLLNAGWTAISLGSRILRIETAAVAVAGYFSLRDGG